MILDLPPPLWVPAKPAIIRPALDLALPKLAMPLTMGMLRPPTVTALTLTYRSLNKSITAGASRTFSSIAIGSASSSRVVACYIAGYSSTARTVSSVSIGGVTATIHTARNSGYFPAIASAVVPSGTTADIVVGLTGSSSALWVAVYTIVGLNSTTPLSSGNNGVAASGSQSVVLTTAAGGVAIAGLNVNVATPTGSYWTAGGIVNDYSENADSSSVSTQGGKVSTSGTSLTITANTAYPAAIAAAAWR